MTTFIRLWLLMLIFFFLSQPGRAEMYGQDGDWLWQAPTGAYGYVGWDQLGIYGYTGTDTNITIPPTVQVSLWNGSEYEIQTKPVVRVSSGDGTPGISSLRSNSSIKSITFPTEATFRRIDQFALAHCSSLTDISIDENVEFIGDYAFVQTGLKSVSIPGGVATIGENAFLNCAELSSVTLHEGLVSLGMLAFGDCAKLQSIKLPSTIGYMGSYTGQWQNYRPGGVFEGCSSLSTVTVTNGADIGKAAFYRCSNLSQVNFVGLQNPANTGSISESAFQDCVLLKNLTLPEGITSIGGHAFAGCSGLTSLTLSPGLVSVGMRAFYRCTNLESITIPPSLTSWGQLAFDECINLTRVTLADGLISVGDSVLPGAATGYTFRGCRKLTSIQIPNSVSRIGTYVFYDCSKLGAAFFKGNAPTMADNVFSGSPITCYYLAGSSGFTSPTWEGYPCFIAAPYGGVIPNIPINEAHLIGGAPSDSNVKLDAPVTQAPLLWQRQTTPATLDMEQTRTLLLGATGTVRVEAEYGALTIGKNPGDGFLTAGGNANTPGTLVLEHGSANDLTINAVITNNGSGVVGLTKYDSGRAILNANNSYSGETSINGGTLVLKSACLADASAVRVASNGTLNLDYSGSDVVGALYIGGTQQADGLYDSTNTGGLITGTGKIQVGPFANYTAWTDANAPDQTADQDHDQDGVPNGIEYFMGNTGNGFTANPGIAADGTVTWPKSPAFSGSYAVQTSADLVEWTDVTEDASQITRNADSVIWTRLADPGSRFIRLVATPN